MKDEAPLRPCNSSHAGDGAGGSAGEPASLRGRASFLENWHWESVVRINERLCRRDGAQHGKNSETHAGCQSEWDIQHRAQRSLPATLDWLRSYHRKAPFLFFNGNTFAEIARTLTDALFAEFPTVRRREAASLAAHYVAGVMDRDAVLSGLVALLDAADFQPGDRVRTLKGSVRGTVRALLKDGRVEWLPDGASNALIALPEALLKC